MRRKTLTFDQAWELQSEAESLLLGSEFDVNSQAVLELVRDSNCSAYDCGGARRARDEAQHEVRDDGQEAAPGLPGVRTAVGCGLSLK